ncbi:MAG: hypothetical protein ACREH4_14520 [Vitreimonas sp.]
MDANALRIWGIAVSGGLIAVALVVALQPAPQAEAQSTSALSFEIAQAPAQAAPISFLVRFAGSGPIARAQRQAAGGNAAEAQREIQSQLRRQEDFSGLCFDRFTAGAAEVVLRTCAAIVPSQRAAMESRWLARLRAMRAVAYVDLNTTAGQGRTG